MSKKSVVIIGSGFAGLSAACFMAKQGWQVSVLEKNAGPGGRAGQLNIDGFSFDTGPSFYWMPEVFDRFFNEFGKKTSDYYKLHRLDPSYRVYWDKGYSDIPADFNALKDLFESIEPGSAVKLEKYLEGAAFKYELGMKNFVFKPGLSLREFMDWKTISGAMKLQVFSSIRNHIAKYFKHPKLRQLMEFPILFLGALPQDTPALYSLMNYADIRGGTWYPEGGMFAVVKAMHSLAVELGVNFYFDHAVENILVRDNKATGVDANSKVFEADALISTADYHFTEMQLLPPAARTYTELYWEKKTMAPSCLLYYVGLNKKLKTKAHHSLFFDVPFDQHGKEIYKDPKWPTNPLFYVSCSSETDPHTAPPGFENLVFLIPVAAGLTGDNEVLRDNYFRHIVRRMEEHTGESILDAVIVKKSWSVSDFVSAYNSYRGNAYGLANTLSQTAVFRPAIRSKKLEDNGRLLHFRSITDFFVSRH